MLFPISFSPNIQRFPQVLLCDAQEPSGGAERAPPGPQVRAGGDQGTGAHARLRPGGHRQRTGVQGRGKVVAEDWETIYVIALA